MNPDPYVDPQTGVLRNLLNIKDQAGNGRAQRAFAAQVARQAGYMLRWDGLDPDENVRASQAIMRGHPGPMRELLTSRVEPLRIGGGVDRSVEAPSRGSSGRPGSHPPPAARARTRLRQPRRLRAPSRGPERG